MTYIPPIFAIFRVNSLNLSAKFDIKLGRFELVADNQDAEKKSNELELLIARINIILKCTTKRDTAKDVFELLVNELRPVLKENDEEKEKDAVTLLLGALLHRYFRIINECKARYANVFWQQKPEDSGLFMAIREALRLPKKKNDKYLEADLEVLDTTTIVTSLEFFRDYMLKDKDGKPQYMQYPHFAKDSNFLYYLNEIIKQQTPESELIIDQFKAINFICSLVKQLEKQRLEMEEGFDSLASDLKKKSVALTIDSIETHIEKYLKDSDLKEDILNLLHTQAINKILLTPDLNLNMFIDKMKVCHSETASLILLGAYTVILQPMTENHQLQFLLHEALNIEINPGALTADDKFRGIRFLEKYLKDNKEIKLNYEYFGKQNTLEQAISQTKEDLARVIGKTTTSNETIKLGMT